MEVGEVRIAKDADFEKLRHLCQCHDGWNLEYQKQSTNVWTKSNAVSEFKMLKVYSLFKDISASVAYDVLNDPYYRKKWDYNMIEGYEICQISPNNDIGYYSMKVPNPLKNRDFVTQRSWLELGNEFLIFNHSVNHVALPPRKNFVRGVSYLTGYHVVSTVGNSGQPGCQVTYVTQCDPRGKLPAWVVNKAAQLLAPKIMTRLYNACRDYESWKVQNKPNIKPWRNPDQNNLPYLNMTDIGSFELPTSEDNIDETNAICQDGNVDDDEADQFTATS